MHDHSLGGMVDVGVNPNANHPGPCNDGVYGCSRCWNFAEGEGTIFPCDWCKKETHTRIVRAWDEPVSYALCKDCRQPSAEELAEIDRYYDDEWNY